jgi:hypothetical protein
MDKIRADIISASRRTDIPAWYTPWFMEHIRQKNFVVTNPFNRKARQVAVHAEYTHSIVFWSKNFGPFLDYGAHTILADMGFNLFFNFTINSRSDLLEPGLPDLGTRLDQAKFLAHRFGPQTVAWRFDPVCFYTKDDLPVENNLDDFMYIAHAMAGFGITTCVTSFYDAYRKVTTRTRHLAKTGKPFIRFIEPGFEDKKHLIRKMAARLAEKQIQLHLCCEADLYQALAPACTNLFENACINGPLLKKIFGGDPEMRRDFGQRTKKGCRCTIATDIGSYQDHPCHHNCLFCYANTGRDTRIRHGDFQ